MRWIAPLLAPLAMMAATPVAALVDDDGTVVEYVVVETVYYSMGEEVPAMSAQRFVTPQPHRDMRAPVARYGPFRVLDDGTAALAGITDERSPAAFAAMLRDYPAIAMLEFHDCPGTYDDRANLRLGRMIRDAGLDVRVPADGSVRSGAVELVLAGRTLTIADGARFAVHAWLDDLGREAGDYAPDSEEHRKYLGYYADVGMTADEAQAFYAMTNSASFDSARWLGGAEMRSWIRKARDAAEVDSAPVQLADAPVFNAVATLPAELMALADAAPAFAEAPLVAQGAASFHFHPAAPAISAPLQIAYLDLDLLLN